MTTRTLKTLDKVVSLLPKQMELMQAPEKFVLFSGAWGAGKEQPYDANVITPNGKVLMGDLKIGDMVCTPNGKNTKIINIFEQGFKDVYTIYFKDGTSVECGLNHLWPINYMRKRTKRINGKRISYFEENTKLLTTQQLLDGKTRDYQYRSNLIKGSNSRLFIKLTDPVCFKKHPITINPYLLGLLLGDGYISNKVITFTTSDKQIINTIKQILKQDYGNKASIVKNNSQYGYLIKFSTEDKGWQGKTNILKQQLEDLGIYNKTSINKFIPKNYIYNTKDVRLEVLRGLMDTDGWHEKKAGGAYFGSISKQLALDTKEIAESLGVDVCNFKEVTKRCTNSKTQATCQFFMFRLDCNNAAFVFGLKRKQDVANKYSKSKYKTRRWIVKIEKTGHKNCRCIQLKNKDGLYLTDNYTITHNSRALCYKVLREAVIPNNVVILCRKTYTSLRRSTLHTLLFESDPVIPRGAYVYNKIEQKITLNGGGSIYCLGVEDSTKIRSMNVGFVAVDEATELSEEEWVELSGRLRLTYGSRQMVAATNPSTPSHHLFKRFFLNNNKNHRVIKATTLDNPYLPKDYVDSLKDLPDDLYRRMVLGEWLALEKAVYKEWTRGFIQRKTLETFKEFFVGVDFGFTNPCAIGLFGVDGDNNIHLIEEQYESELKMSQIVNRCDQYQKYEPVVIVDPSAPALIAEFNDAGFNSVKANNDISEGITRLQDVIHNQKFTVDPSCTEFVNEIENYSWDNKGKPIKLNDHLMDLTRYVISYLGDRLENNKKIFACTYSDTVDEHKWIKSL